MQQDESTLLNSSGSPQSSASEKKLMMLKLPADQISNMWNLFEYALWNSVPPGITPSEGFLANTLAACIAGDLQCWLSFQKRADNTREILGVVITYIDNDECSGDKNLLIYSLYGYGKMPTRMWAEGMETLKKYAKGAGCKRILAFTSHENVMKIAKFLDCNAEVSVLQWEIE